MNDKDKFLQPYTGAWTIYERAGRYRIGRPRRHLDSSTGVDWWTETDMSTFQTTVKQDAQNRLLQIQKMLKDDEIFEADHWKEVV